MVPQGGLALTAPSTRLCLTRSSGRILALLPAHLILEVLDVLQLPATPGRLGPATFPYRFENGTPSRWIEPVHALLIFLKRIRTRGSTAIQMQSFFGRSVGYLSEVANAVLT